MTTRNPIPAACVTAHTGPASRAAGWTLGLTLAITLACAPASRADDGGLFSGGLRAQLLVPAALTGRGSATEANDPRATRTVAFGLLADARLRLPDPVGRLSVFAEAGWFRLTSTGTRGAASDPDFGVYGFDWTVDGLPLALGLAVDLVEIGPVRITAAAAANAVLAWSTGAFTIGGDACTTDCRAVDPTHQTLAFGWQLDVEGSMPLGPGRLVGGWRYADTRSRFPLPAGYGTAYSPDRGMLMGSSVLLGYRF